MAKTENDPKSAGADPDSKPAAANAGGMTAAKSETGSAQQTATADSQPKDAIELLKADHRLVESLFAQYESADDGQKRELVHRICSELVVHTLIEEEIFYPACRQAAGDEEPLNEAQVEHDSAKLLIADLMAGAADDPYRDAKVKTLSEQIKHHVGEEEAPGRGIFAKARANHVDIVGLGERLRTRKQALQAQPDRRPSRPVSLHRQTGLFAGQQQEEPMPRQYSSNDRDRDERGRFTSDDDREGGRYSASSGRGRSYRDDDDGRGWHGDPQGHSEASRRGWDERRSFAGGDDDDDRRSGYRGAGRDEEGRFTSRGGRDDDDYRRGSGRGHGGWSGDPEGHSEASRRGWDEREGGMRARYRDDDDDRRGYRSRGRDDEDYGRDRGQGGWFGDSEGHAEAARRGRDERGGSRGGGYSDDDRGYRARGRDEEGRFTSRGGRDDDDDRRRSGRGHGGWFGDPEGHAEASRRGWEDRR